MFQFGKKTDERKEPGATAAPAPAPAPPTQPLGSQVQPISSSATDVIRDQVFSRIDPAVAVRLTKAELTMRVDELVAGIANEQRLLLNQIEQHALAASIVDEMVGLGALEPLLRDTSVSDILVNGSRTTYVERRGKLELTPLRFRNNAHVLHVAQRIASSVGRRVD